MSRVLMLLPSLPTTLDSGARIRNSGLLSLLSARHRVDVIAFGTNDTRVDLGPSRVRCIPPPPRRSTLRRARDLATSALPDMALRLESTEFARAVDYALREDAYDAVQAEGIEMAGYLGRVPPAHRVYDAHNPEFLLQRRLSDGAPSLAARLYSRVQWRRLARFEGEVVRASRMTLAVSEHDANQLLALAGSSTEVQVVPNGIDVRAHAFEEPTSQQQPNLLFMGKLDFRPNAEALRWFVREVLPALGTVRLFAVGAAPPAWLVAEGQNDSRIAVTGYVVDERPYLRRAMAMVLPVRSGGGSRLKALIAMASGLPIVSTRVGMEGLEAEPGVHFVAAESARDFAQAIQRLCDDLGLRTTLAHNARTLVEERYDWTSIGPRLHAAYAWLDA